MARNRQLVIKIAGDARGAVDALGKVEGKLGKLTSVVGVAAKGLGALGTAVGAGAAASVKAFASFDAAMTESLAIMGDVSYAMEQEMAQAAREVAKTTTFSAQEAAEAFYFLASAGLDAAQSVEALPQVAQFAQAGMFDLAQATDLLTDAQSALGLTSEDAAQNLENMARVSDVLVTANTLANASVEQFSEALTNKAGAAIKVVGKDIEEGVAVLAAFADQGIKGAEAGTALNIVFRELQTKAIKNKEEFDALGVAVFDASGEMRNTADIIGDLEGALEGMSDEQKKATLLQLGFADKSVAFIQTLLGESEAIREYESELREAGGTTEEVANRQLQTLGAQFGILKSKVTDLAIEVGEKLAPYVLEAVDTAGEWADSLSGKLGPAIDNVRRWVGDVVEKVREVVSWFQDATSAGGQLEPVMAALGEVVEGMRMRVQFLLDVGREIVSWFGESIGKASQTGGAFSRLGDVLRSTFETVGRTFEVVHEITSEVFSFLIERVQEMSVRFEDIFSRVSEIVSSAMEAISIVISVVTSVISEIWERWGDNILAVAGFIFGAVLDAIDGALSIIQGILDVFVGLFTGDWERMWDGVKGILDGALTIITGLIDAGLGIILSIGEVVLGVFEDIWEDTWEGLTDTASGAWETFTEWLEGVWETFTGWWSTAWETLGDIVGGAFAGISDKVRSLFNGILDLIERGINNAVGFLNDIIGGINRLNPFADIPTIPSFSLPRLAAGGTAVNPGMALVGERGPELIHLPRGATVTPLTMDRELIAALHEVAQALREPPSVDVTVPIEIDGEKVATAAISTLSKQMTSARRVV